MTVTPDARAAFEQWALRQPGHPGDVQSLVHDVEESADHVGLLATDVQGRRVVWKSVPYAGRERITFPALAVEAVDAWSVDASALRAGSEHIAICDGCAGEGKIGCNACAAVGKTVCVICGGQRKMYGYAANGSRRLLNCQSCRGKGEVDCAHCRRGVATCGQCAGERRVQKWMELECWSRSVANEHPRPLAQQFGISATATNAHVLRDAEIVADTEKPHRLTALDLGSVPANWLDHLAPVLQPGERVTRQRLRIARVPRFTVRYRVGGDEDRVTFAGRRLIAPAASPATVFARRASNLRSLFALLCVIGGVMVLLSLARGIFFWSLATFFSILAFAGMLGGIYGAVADWTSVRKHTGRWLIASAGCLALATLLALAALPRHAHVERLIAAGKLDAAESELNALGSDAGAAEWAALHLARIRAATQISSAREELAKIPAGLAQRIVAEDLVDRLVLQKAAEHSRLDQWAEGAAALELLSQRGRQTTESVTAATTIYVPFVRQKLVRTDWRDAANAIATARTFGVAPDSLEPLATEIHEAAVKTAAEAKEERDTSRRLRLRLTAEETFVSWDIATGSWGAPSLIALRTVMARDVAALERRRRR
jgi:hypothetical protein